jgi:hypothetical protein
MIPRLTLLAAMALLAAPSLAQAPVRQPAQAHLGAWSFKTQPYAGGCVLSGQMRITQPSAGPLSCRFNAVETCPGRVSKATQTCAVSRTGNAVKITSKVVHTDSPSYVPDNFEVELTSPTEMRGMMRSFNSAPVVFRRSEQAIS